MQLSTSTLAVKTAKSEVKSDVKLLQVTLYVKTYNICQMSKMPNYVPKLLRQDMMVATNDWLWQWDHILCQSQ